MSKNSILGIFVMSKNSIVLNVVATDVDRERDFGCVSDPIPTSELRIFYLYSSYNPF